MHACIPALSIAIDMIHACIALALNYRYVHAAVWLIIFAPPLLPGGIKFLMRHSAFLMGLITPVSQLGKHCIEREAFGCVRLQQLMRHMDKQIGWN